MQQRKTIPVSQIIQPTGHIFSSWIEKLHSFKRIIRVCHTNSVPFCLCSRAGQQLDFF